MERLADIIERKIKKLKEKKKNECTSHKPITRQRIFKNGSSHIEKVCSVCGKHFGFKRNKEDLTLDYIMPFGKYKGQTIREIMQFDLEYLDWFATRRPINNFKNKIMEAIYGLPKDI